MNKHANRIYVVVGCIFPIFIGALHLFAHFKYLITPEVNQVLQEEILIFGEAQTFWNTWGIMSVMMGMAFIVIGLLNITIVKDSAKRGHPPITAILAMIVYLISVIYVGYEFEQAPQFYGGIFGLILITICGILTIQKKA